jgi:dTDP-4-dehydrorhamnose reductase
MRIWVPGANGLLGTEVVARLARDGIDHVATDAELDIRDPRALEAFAAATPFTHVINCAAFAKVDACETQEAEAFAVNATGAGNIARVAAGKPALHVSTDYVFDGSATAPYREDASTGPISAYGRTKLAGERAFLDGNPRAYVVRTSWLFGPAGPSFVATMLKLLATRPEVRVVDDQVGRPTASVDLAAALIAIATREPAPGIYHFANAGQVTWFGFASAIKDLAKLPAALHPITTVDYPTPAKRPAWSVLSTEKLERIGIVPRPWRDALIEQLPRMQS